MTGIQEKVVTELVPRINEFQLYQEASRAVNREHTRAAFLLGEIMTLAEDVLISLNQHNYATHLITDLRMWKNMGLSKVPYFDRSLLSYDIPAENELTFFLAPITTPNSKKKKVLAGVFPRAAQRTSRDKGN